MVCGLGVVKEVRERVKCGELGDLSFSFNFVFILLLGVWLSYLNFMIILCLFFICKIKKRIIVLFITCCCCEVIDGEKIYKMNSVL